MSFDTTWLAGWLESTGLWLLTYSAHSTLLLGAAWLLHRRLPRYSETLWKTALLGGLLTSSMQLALGLPSIGGTIALAGSATLVEETSATAVVSPSPAVRSASPGKPGAVRALSSNAVERSPIAAGTEPRTASASPKGLGFSSQWAQLAGVLWLIGALALTTRLAARNLRFRLRVRGRRRVTVGDLARRFDRLRARSPSKPRIRITSTNGISVPFAKGGFRPEICLPERVLTDLDQEKQDAILAHELAHHESNDPVWHLLNELTATLLFFQPLNRKACRELREQAELRCDRRAVALTGRPVALARCLTEIAGWTLPQAPVPIAAALSSDGSSLSRRVSRLLSKTGGPDRGSTKWAALVSATLLLVALGLAPGFSSEAPGFSPATPPEPVEPPPVAPAPVVTEIEPPSAPALALAEPLVTPPAAFVVRVPSLATAPAVAVAPVPEAAPVLAPASALAAVPVSAPMPLAAALAAPVLAPVPAFATAQVSAPMPLAAAFAAPAPSPVAPREAEAEQEEVEDEDLDEEIEAEMEAFEEAMEEIEEIIETEIERVLEEMEEAIELQAEVFEEEVERQMESMEETMENMAEEIEKKARALASARADGATEAERETLQAEISAMGRAMGELGAIVGRHFGGSFGADIAAAVIPVSEIAARIGSQQGELGRLLGERMSLIHAEGRQPTPEEMRELREEIRLLAEEMRPQREEIERMRRELEESLGPLRDRIRESQEQMRIEMEEWRRKYEEAGSGGEPTEAARP